MVNLGVLVSGSGSNLQAIIENIVSRAKLAAVKELIGSGRKGITRDHLRDAMREEYTENEDLPRNTNPAEWYRILGMLSARVREERAHLWQDLEILGDLDLLYAMARLSIVLESVPPELHEGEDRPQEAGAH
jgi:hypothetical protein